MTTVYDLGLSAANGRSFAMRRIVVEAEDIHEAIALAEGAEPGFRVHHAWADGGDNYPRINSQDEEWWMATHIPQVIRTQVAGSEQEEEGS